MTLPVKLQNDEKVIREVRRHPAAVTLQIVADVIGGILLVLLINWLSGVVPSRQRFGISPTWSLSWARCLSRLSPSIAIEMTSGRLPTNGSSMVKSSPFNHSVASTDLINVQDIAIQKKGILATTFNFGDVVCQTASTKGNFTFRGVPNPTQLLEEVGKLRDEALRSTGPGLV